MMLPYALRFGSPADIAILLLVTLIIFGPKELPSVGKELGQAMRELRKITDTNYRFSSLAVAAVILGALTFILVSNGFAR